VSQEQFDNEKEIRRFLLGEMSAEERTAFEERFIAEDGELFERIGVGEDELIESYIRGTLSPVEKASFEQNFLTTETRRRRVAFTREMFDKLAARKEAAAKKTEAVAEKTPVWNSLINLFTAPRAAFGAGLAVLLLVFGGWFLISRNSPNRTDIARQASPTPTLSQTPPKPESDQNTNGIPNLNSASSTEANKVPANIINETPNKNQPPAAVPKPIVATVALFAGTVRAEGKTSELNLTKETTGANFQLNLESRDYQTYRAEIVDADGGVIYRSAKLNARANRINAFFPTAKLKKGDYFVRLYGFNPAGAEESAADFQFRVNQK
jgi:hypothetical protein